MSFYSYISYKWCYGTDSKANAQKTLFVYVWHLCLIKIKLLLAYQVLQKFVLSVKISAFRVVFVRQVHKVKPQVLQFLLDLAEIQTDAAANSSAYASTFLDDDSLDGATKNDQPVHRATNGTSLGCDQMSAASDQRLERAASTSDEGDGDSRESNRGDAGRYSVPGTNSIDRDLGLSVKGQITPRDVTPSSLMDFTAEMNTPVSECSEMRSYDEKRTEYTSSVTSECELKSTVYDRCSAETSAGLSTINSEQQKCCLSDNSMNFASECLSCRRCCAKFDNADKQQEHVCGLKVAKDQSSASGDCQTLEQMSSVLQCPCNTKTEHDGQRDVSVKEEGEENRKLSSSMTTLARDVTWNTLIGTESSNKRMLSGDTQSPTKLQGYEFSANEMSAGSTPVRSIVNDRRTRTVSSGSDSNGEEHDVSPGEFSHTSVSRLFSNAWNALLLHIGLECVNKFNRSLRQHSDRECDFQFDSGMSKSDEDGGPCVRAGDSPRTTFSGDDEENLTNEGGQSEAERCRRLTCFYCLQRFADAQALQTHFDRTHSQQQSIGGAFHSKPDQHRESVINSSGVSNVTADSSTLATTVSGHVASAAGVWDRLPDSASSSYFGGISPEILGLLSTVPPELMLQHVYPGGILPPAMMLMMLASPFVGCPSSPLPNSLSALADPHAGLLPSAADSHAAYDDAGMASVQQQSKRARTRITDSQLAILRARFDINGPPNDEEIAAIGSEIGLPSKVVKHWFRNTLFKERQRCKDSPYNFSVPPACDLSSVSSSSVAAEKAAETAIAEVGMQSGGEDRDYERHDVRSDSSLPATVNSKVCPSSLPQPSSSTTQSITAAAVSEAPYFARGCYYGMPYPPAPQALPLLPSVTPIPPANVGGAQIVSVTSTSTGVAAHHPPATTQSRGGHGKRASRTHFSDEQVRTLQEHFERNAYPRDDELESLSRRLGLSARVIVVWFQNARQKARRTYENHSSAAGGNGSVNGASKTDDGVGGPRYDCRSCGAAFQRYYELIKHQRSHVGCGAIVPSTSTTKYSAQPPSNAVVTTARHDGTPLRFDKPPGTAAAAAAAATMTSPSYRQHYNHRRHQTQQPRVEPWYRSPVEGYVGAVSPRGPEVVNALPVQHALPAVFPPHLPLLTPWSSAPGSKEESISGSSSSGVDMTASRRQTNLIEKNCETKFVVDRTPSEESANKATADQRDSGRQSVVGYDDDRKPLLKDLARQSPEQPPNSMEETSYSSADSKRRGLAEVTLSHLHHRTTAASPTAPSSAAVMFSGSSAEQHGRQLLGGGEVVATSLSSPRHSYDIQRRTTSLDNAYFAPKFGLSTTSAGEDESPLDLTCQGKTTLTWSAGDRSSESLRENAAAEELKPFGPAASAADGGSLSLGGSGTTSKSQQSGGSSKRYRTHMSDLQVRVMRAIYADHRTPSIGECATLGAKIGLARRVVQVWFQNARAKDKKRCLTEGALDDGSGPGDSDGGMAAGDGRCRWCGVTYSVERCSVREHVFSPEHVVAVDRIVRASTDAERRGGATVGRASKRDHRRRLLHRSLTSNSPAAMSSSSMSATSSASSVARKFVDVASLQFLYMAD